jgi:mannose-6-phosphate isomerase-like protein (cupin superfamily)
MIDAIVTPPAIAGEPLDPDGLRDLVDGLARTPGLWAPRVRHDPEDRVFDLLWLDERVEVWLICWSGEDHDTGFHDHDISSGAFAVVKGELVEERLTIGHTIRRRLRKGQSLGFPPSHVHRVHGVDRTPAVSIHAYSPPLARLGVYALSDDGALRRESVSASHELRSDTGPEPINQSHPREDPHT